jgi:uridine phosphorylase
MIEHSELIINPDGTIFHLHAKKEDLAQTILLVGDPARCEMIAGFFDKIDFSVKNREFETITGWYKQTHLSVISTGIGTDNIDIVVNELDALFNIDIETREIKEEKTQLNLIRVGTSGSLDKDIPVNSYVISEKSIGFDGLINFYANRNEVSDLEFEKAFLEHMNWSNLLAKPYVVKCSTKLLNKITDAETINGINISSPGFYGPQGRVLRLQLADPDMNSKIESFQYKNHKITNYEMESSAIYGLSRLMGHEALTICLIIANRVTGEANENYYHEMNGMIKFLLDKLSS